MLYILNPVPVHINSGNCKRNIFSLKSCHQIKIFLLRICMVSAPPHAKSKTRNKRSRRTDFIKCLYGFPVIPAVSKGIVILGIFISCNKIALFVNEHCFAVIKKISTVFCNKTVIKRNLSKSHIKCSACSL